MTAQTLPRVPGVVFYDVRARRVEARFGRGRWRVDATGPGDLITFRYWQHDPEAREGWWHPTTITFTMTRREFWA